MYNTKFKNGLKLAHKKYEHIDLLYQCMSSLKLTTNNHPINIVIKLQNRNVNFGCIK